MCEEKKDSAELSFGTFFEEVSICGTVPISQKCIKFNFICFQQQVIKKMPQSPSSILSSFSS